MSDLAFVLPGPLETRTGGFIYDRRIIDGLRSQGRRIEVLELTAAFPFPSAQERETAEETLSHIPSGLPAVVDGLALGALPEAAVALARRGPLIALIHHPLALETGLHAEQVKALVESERRALAPAQKVIASSRTTAQWLLERGWLAQPASVVEPGTEAAPLSKGSGGGPVQLLCVATLIPRKGHLLLLEALSQLRDLPWELTCAGAARDPETAGAVEAAIARLDLGGRVRLLGEVAEPRLDALYDAADLFVLASHHEGFGMVVTEAVMCGLPVIATAGGAIAQTLPPDCGLLSPPGGVAGLRENLARAIADKDLRARLRAATMEARRSLPSWQEAAACFAAACGLE